MDNNFYELLRTHRGQVAQLLGRNELFSAVPEDWHVVVTDISGSSVAVAAGLHKTVNLIATGSIVCVLNISRKHNIVIPFFFGGDGATFLIPNSLVAEVLGELVVYRDQVFNSFGLVLRVGNIAVSQIYAAGQKLRIAKYRKSSKLVLPMVTGNGLNYAEILIKGSDALIADKTSGHLEVDLSGLQCRWDQFAPPIDTNEILTLLVSAVKDNDQGPIFGKVLNELDQIYGFPHERQPISESRLKITSIFWNVRITLLTRTGSLKWYNVLKEWLSVSYEYLYFQLISGKHYLNALVETADTLVLDGRINTVISGDEKQRERLMIFLADLEDNGEILFGMHISQGSVISCYVPDHRDGEIHFIDGSEGGYTNASRMLKRKLHK